MEEIHHGFTRGREGERKQPSAIPPAATKPRSYPVGLAGASKHKKNREFYERSIGRLVAELGLARENERQKIANELHDHVAQNLALAKMKLGLLKRSLPRKQMLMVRDIYKLISEVIEETRSLMCDLYSPPIGDLGLIAALEWLIQRTRVRYGLACDAEIVSMPAWLPPEVEDTIFQAVRELLINAAKHARARQTRVIVRDDERWMLIQVIDDGKGFKPARHPLSDLRYGGFGLPSIRERLSRIGGSMHVDSSPGQGAKITITCPINTDRRAYDACSGSHQ